MDQEELAVEAEDAGELPEGGEAGDTPSKSAAGSKKKRNWQKVNNLSEFYAPQSYEVQKAAAKGKGKGKDGEGERGKDGKGVKGKGKDGLGKAPYGVGDGNQPARSKGEEAVAPSPIDGAAGLSGAEMDGARDGKGAGGKRKQAGSKSGGRGFGPSDGAEKGGKDGGKEGGGRGRGSGKPQMPGAGGGGDRGAGRKGVGSKGGPGGGRGMLAPGAMLPPPGAEPGLPGEGLPEADLGGAPPLAPGAMMPVAAPGAAPGAMPRPRPGMPLGAMPIRPAPAPQAAVKGGPGVGLPPGSAPIAAGMPLAGIPLAGMAGMPYQAFAQPMGQYGGGMPYLMPYYIMPSPQTPLSVGSTPYAPGDQPAPCGPPPPLAPVDRQGIKDQVQFQLEYYFGTENLLKDLYLRQRMDEEGWVDISLVEQFKRMSKLTNDHSIVMEAINSSQSIELDSTSTKIRLRNNWKTWILKPSQVPDQAALPPAPMPGAPPSRS